MEDVVWFVKDADPQALGPHVELFRKHVSMCRACVGGGGGRQGQEGWGRHGRRVRFRELGTVGGRASGSELSSGSTTQGKPVGTTGFLEHNHHLVLF